MESSPNARTEVSSWWAGAISMSISGQKVAYPAYVDALVASGYQGYMDWEFCHPGLESGKPVGIDYVHKQTELAFEYLLALRASAERKIQVAAANA